ncbi:MAG: hypothetical protein Kow006_11410 [Gammaproteobacteria bacterium]
MGARALEIETVGDLPVGLVHCVGQLVEIHLGNDIERGHEKCSEKPWKTDFTQRLPLWRGTGRLGGEPCQPDLANNAGAREGGSRWPVRTGIPEIAVPNATAINQDRLFDRSDNPFAV